MFRPKGHNKICKVYATLESLLKVSSLTHNIFSFRRAFYSSGINTRALSLEPH